MKPTKKQLTAFKTIIDTYKNATEIPKSHNWKKLDKMRCGCVW